MFKKVLAWWHRHPAIKTSIVGVGGAAFTAATAGMFGPKAAAAAGAISTLVGLFIKRPQDGAATEPKDKSEVKSEAK